MLIKTVWTASEKGVVKTSMAYEAHLFTTDRLDPRCTFDLIVRMRGLRDKSSYTVAVHHGM